MASPERRVRAQTPAGARARAWAGSLRAAAGAVSSSLTARLLGVIVVYAAAVALVLALAGEASDALFTNAFPTMDAVLAHADDLADDRFSALQGPDLAHGGIVVFDERGARLYASSEKAADNIRPSLLPFINDYAERSFYEVFQEDTDGACRYRILLCSYVASDDYAKQIDAEAELDENLNIIGGDLFPGRAALTQREFNFIKGIYDAQKSVERYDYATATGEARTLVLVAPRVSAEAYNLVLDKSGQIAFYVVPVLVVITVAAAWVLVRLVRGAVRPLDRAIDAYRSGGAVSGGRVAPGGGAASTTVRRAPSAESVPRELMPTYRNFTSLMDRLRAAQNERQRLIADVSHDLKTPLTVISGYAQAFNEGVVPPEKERDYHRAMHDKALAASRLIDTLGEYARMEHPEAVHELEEVDLAAFVREVAAEALQQVEQAGNTFACEAEGHAVVRIDRQLFRRALLNLIENACVHNDAGIAVRIAVEAPDGCAARVSVADTGAGVPADLAPYVFEPFVTENTARTPRGGTGLGLAIVRRAVEVMGGTVRLVEHPEAPWATAFIIELPRA